jgi:hypothetical protein
VHPLIEGLKERLGNLNDSSREWEKDKEKVPEPIKAIQTHYKGYKFRSRLEARWAVFMDFVKVKWEYEVQGFVLSSGRPYLPDFWLPELSTWLEIKPWKSDTPWPTEGSVEEEFQNSPPEGTRVVILFGSPGVSGPSDSGTSYACCVCGDSPYFWCQCPDCGAIGIQYDGRSGRNENHKTWCTVDSDRGHNWDSEFLRMGFDAARSARFEHGETP